MHDVVAVEGQWNKFRSNQIVALSETISSTATITTFHLTFLAKGMAYLPGPINLTQKRVGTLFSPG